MGIRGKESALCKALQESQGRAPRGRHGPRSSRTGPDPGLASPTRLPYVPAAMLRPLFALFVLALSFAPATAAPAAQAQDDLSQLKGQIDGSVRWLRSTQNPAEGSYGGGVEATSWVLYALAKCHRAYEAADGPFVSGALDYLVARQAENGSIADEGAQGGARIAQTRAAAAALSVHVTPKTAPVLGKAVVWLGEQGIDEPGLDLLAVPADNGDATKLGLRLLSTRGRDGKFEGPKGAVIETAKATIALSKIKKQLAPKDGGSKTARPLPKFTAATRAELDAAVLKGARFLLAAGDGARWGAPGRPDAGLTAMVVGALQAVPQPRPGDVQTAIDDALAWLVTLQDEQGAIHQGRTKNYVTSAAIMALAEVPAYAPQIAKARKFIEELQADGGEGYSEGDLFYGGIGYGGDERPDLSNLQMAMEALVAAGATKDDPSMQKALKFLERCQNRSETNDVELTRKGIVIKPGDDGGAGYAPGDSKAGFIKLPDGTQVPRSYGSMTYALLKGFVFAGLDKEDPRVKACWKWLSANYTLDINPGHLATGDPTAPYKGLYYYFNSMATALDVYGATSVKTPDGVEHDWRAELAGRLISMQDKADGSWINRNANTWWEGNPVMATAYALRALGTARE